MVSPLQSRHLGTSHTSHNLHQLHCGIFLNLINCHPVFLSPFYCHRTHCIIPESLLNHLNSFCGGIFKLNANFDLWLYSFSYFECHGHTVLTYGIYCPHWLPQWSRHCSHMRIPVHSPWLPGYIDFAQTTLVTLTMAALFPDRPRIFSNIIKYLWTFNSKYFFIIHFMWNILNICFQFGGL